MKLFDRITLLIGVLFFGSWIVCETFFYVKAIYDFVITLF